LKNAPIKGYIPQGDIANLYHATFFAPFAPENPDASCVTKITDIA
jgi:hypothetical protein